MHLRNFTQQFRQSVLQLTKSFLDENPVYLKRYVNAGMLFLDTAITSLDMFMEHMIVVQGLDPKAEPGLAARKQLEEALNQVFLSRHTETYDKDFDFSFLKNKFEETKRAMQDETLTEERFVSMTNLQHLSDVPEDKVEKPLNESLKEDLGSTTLKNALIELVSVIKDMEDSGKLSKLEDKKEVWTDSKSKVFRPTPREPQQASYPMEQSKVLPSLLVEKEAKVIQHLIEKGHLDPADFDELVLEGLNPEAIEFWKKRFGKK